MDIMELGAIGELVGGVAVIASLLYVGAQVRQSNRASSRESYRNWVSEINQVWHVPMRDPEFMELFQRANRDWNSLSGRDQGVVHSVYASMFLLFQEVFAQRQRGEIDEHLTLQFDSFSATIVQTPGIAAWWEMVRPFWSPSFGAHLDELVASEDCPPPLHEALPFYLEEPGA